MANPINLNLAWEEICGATARDERLTATFGPTVRQYEVSQNLPQGSMKLGCIAIDSRHNVITKSQDHTNLKRQFSEKNKGNAIVCHIVSSVDGRGVFVLPLCAATSPSNTDERIMKYITDLEINRNLLGGFLDFITGPQNVFVVILMDLGYKGWFVNQQATFTDTLDQINIQQQGRVNYRFPPSSRDRWYNSQGIQQPPPVPLAGVNSPPTPLLEVSANSGCIFCTKFRGAAEWVFLRVWQDRILGRGDKIWHQYLEEYGKPPAPHTPKIMVLLQNHLALSHQFKKPHSPMFELPPGITRKNIGEMLIGRLELHNFLDPLRTNLGWLRNDIFGRTLQAERVRNGGVVREGNAMDRRFTQFPIISSAMINEMGGGSYQASLTRQYTTAFRRTEVTQQAGPWVDIDTFHQLREQPLQDLPCSTFDQVQPPLGWIGPWQPIRIMRISDIPSRFTNAGRHCVIIAYVPDHVPADPNQNLPALPGWHLQYPGLGYCSQELQRIIMFCCGPRACVRHICPIGARTVVPCGHTLFCVYAAGLLSHDPGAFVTTHQRVNYIDVANPIDFNEELWSEHLN